MKPATQQFHSPAWFLSSAVQVRQLLQRRAFVSPWVAWLMRIGAIAGEVLVFTDDNTDKTIDLLIACHLVGCGYSACDTRDEIPARTDLIANYGRGRAVRVVDVAAARLETVLDDALIEDIDNCLDQVRQDISLSTRTAYLMPTSGSTGKPKLVEISHGSLALLCDAVRHTYGWTPEDTILQCAPLTSDISVEEIFGAASCGSRLVRSTAMKERNLAALAHAFITHRATVVDLPTAVWHLLCDDGAAMDAIGRSALRQIVVGGEAIRPTVVDKWTKSISTQSVTLISSYGPTEATVVVTYLPITGDAAAVSSGARLRLGRPMVPNTVFIAFGEVVIVGDMVSYGYLGTEGHSFGTVTAADGSNHRAFATADRVSVDDDGYFRFAGRKDAVVKIAGKRVDTAAVLSRLSADPAISDVAVELHNGGLGVWFETHRTRHGSEDVAAAARIRGMLVSQRVSSFFVVGVPHIPRKPNGKVDSKLLLVMPHLQNAATTEAETADRAAGLAQIWSRHLGRSIRPNSSLLEEGVGSLDLIRILPDTRRYLRWHLSVLDLISADTATNLVDEAGSADGWMDVDTAAEIERALATLRRQSGAVRVGASQPSRGGAHRVGGPAIVVLGASGILGTGFAQAVLDLKRSAVPCPPVVFAARSTLPERDPWGALRDFEGIRIERLCPDFGRAELDALLRETGAQTVVNCVGNTNVLVPYRELRSANVDLVSMITEACVSRGVRMVHLSTFVVNADVAESRVTDPRHSPYPYAASKSLAELIVAEPQSAPDFSIVRLPRVLGENFQLCDSTDILVSLVEACIALQSRPFVTLTEEVTTGRAAAAAILGLLPELAGTAELGRGITVVRGEPVAYAEFLRHYAGEELEVAEWKQRLDQSEWATRNPRRWSVVDAWVSLGMRLGTRSYAEYLAQYPSIAVPAESVGEVVAKPRSTWAPLAHDCYDDVVKSM